MPSVIPADPDRPPAPAGPTRSAPVITDVARLAGVSHQTVSRVLNGHPNIRPATRDRVQQAIDTLGYRRNPAARALVTRQTLTIGVLAFNTTLYGPASTLYGVERAVHEAGYATNLTTAETTSRAAVLSALDQLRARSVDGVVVAAPLHEVHDIADLLPRGLPVVAVAGGEVHGLPSVHVDHRAGARAATEHLLSLGHRGVAHVAGPGCWVETVQRRQGWQDALADAGIRAPDALPGSWSAASGYEAGLRLAQDRDVTAVFAANDHMALGLLRAFRERAVDVPGQVSVVGFDDVPEADYFAPPLTTVRQDFASVGRRSIALLLEQVGAPAPRGGDAPSVVVPAELVRRASSGPRAG